MRKTLTFGALAVIIAALVGGGIGYALNSSNNESSSTTAGGTALDETAQRASATANNAQDVMFAQMMTPHHQQALEMAKMASTQSSNPKVKALAATIQSAQQPEITTMQSWLSSWGASSNMAGMDMSMMNNSGTSMSGGMMSAGDMQKLGTLTGSAFDKEFLTMMISHHNGAIGMAKDELRGGQYADALGLAAGIQVTQQAQVAQMQDLLKQV